MLRKIRNLTVETNGSGEITLTQETGDLDLPVEHITVHLDQVDQLINWLMEAKSEKFVGTKTGKPTLETPTKAEESSCEISAFQQMIKAMKGELVVPVAEVELAAKFHATEDSVFRITMLFHQELKKVLPTGVEISVNKHQRGLGYMKNRSGGMIRFWLNWGKSTCSLAPKTGSGWKVNEQSMENVVQRAKDFILGTQI